MDSAPAELGGRWCRVHRREDGARGGRQGSRLPLWPCCSEGACSLLVHTLLSWIVLHHKARRTGRLEKQVFVSVRTGGWKSQARAAAGPVSGEGPPPGLRTVSSARGLTWQTEPWSLRFA